MTTVCFLPLEPSACRGTRVGAVLWAFWWPRAWGWGMGWAPATNTSLLQPAPSVGWSWVPRSGLSSCPQPVLPSLGARCGPRYHCHYHCCHCCRRHHHPQESLGREKPLGYWVLERLSPLGSQLYFPHLGFLLHLEAPRILDSNSNQDPSLLEILPQRPTAQDDSPAPQSAFKALHVIPS